MSVFQGDRPDEVVLPCPRRAIERREILKYAGLTMPELGERHHAVLLEVRVSVQVRDNALRYESLKGRLLASCVRGL